jgi:hypothetical protein
MDLPRAVLEESELQALHTVNRRAVNPLAADLHGSLLRGWSGDSF